MMNYELDKPDSKELVSMCLYNWLGYGNINSWIWFIGTEEGGAEVTKGKLKNYTESLELRKGFSHSMDFRDVWENQYGFDLSTFKSPSVWRFIVAFILFIKNPNLSIEDAKGEVKKYLFELKKLGAKDSDHFLCELFPLPKPKKHKVSPYGNIWKSVKEYHKEVLQKRLNLIFEKIKENHKVRLLVVYERVLRESLIDYLTPNQWTYKSDKFKLYKLNHDSIGREIYLLSTPFFGQGHISYSDLKESAELINLEMSRV